MYFLLVPKESTKEKAPHEATPCGVRSFAKGKSARNLTRSAALRSDRNCSLIGFSFSSLTGFKGTPLGMLPSYSIRSFDVTGYVRFQIFSSYVQFRTIPHHGTISVLLSLTQELCIGYIFQSFCWRYSYLSIDTVKNYHIFWYLFTYR